VRRWGKPQYLDSNNPLCMKILEESLKKTKTILIEEMLPHKDSILKSNNGLFVNENLIQWYQS